MKSKNLIRYKKSLIIWIIIITLFVVFLLLNWQLIGSFSIYIILTRNHWIDSVLILLSIPIFSIVAYFLGGYLLTPLLILLHKKIVGRNLMYGIKERNKPLEFKGAFLNSIFPSLFAFNFAILLSNESWIHDLIFSASFMTGASDAILQILTILFLLPFVSALGIGIFSATYFLIDSGIMYTNKNLKKVQRGAFPTEVRSLGGYYLYFLKGYAGISVIISIVQLLINYFMSIQDLDAIIYLVNLILWPFMPFLIALFMVPSAIIQDYSYESRNNFVKKWAKKFGITDDLEDPLGLSR